MADTNDDHLGVGDAVEDQVRDRAAPRCAAVSDDSCAGRCGDIRQEIDGLQNARLDTQRSLGGPVRDSVGDAGEFGHRLRGIAQSQRPCFAQTARTCSSVANSPRSTCSRDLASDASSADAS